MSWHFSQALVAEYLAEFSADGEQFAPLKSTDMPETYCWRDRTTESLNLFQYGMTSDPSTGDPGVELLTWFREASRARTSALPDGEPVSEEPGQGFGHRWRESWVRYNRDTCSRKTHRHLFDEDLPWSSVTLPRWGMMRDGVLLEPTTQVRLISVTGSGLWRTPTVSSANRGAMRGSVRLERGQTMSMQDQVADPKMWPTPTVCGNYNRKGASQTSGSGLETMVRAGEKLGVQLNPAWVEWLMGWPIGWTDCAASVTDRFLQWRHLHGGF